MNFQNWRASILKTLLLRFFIKRCVFYRSAWAPDELANSKKGSVGYSMRAGLCQKSEHKRTACPAVIGGWVEIWGWVQYMRSWYRICGNKGLFWRFWYFGVIYHRESPGTFPWPPRPVWWFRATLWTFAVLHLYIWPSGVADAAPGGHRITLDQTQEISQTLKIPKFKKF